jgi:hypothetical protein
MRNLRIEMIEIGKERGGEKIRYIETADSLRDRGSNIGYQILISSDKIKKDKIGLYPIIEVIVSEENPPKFIFSPKRKKKIEVEDRS